MRSSQILPKRKRNALAAPIGEAVLHLYAVCSALKKLRTTAYPVRQAARNTRAKGPDIRLRGQEHAQLPRAMVDETRPNPGARSLAWRPSQRPVRVGNETTQTHLCNSTTVREKARALCPDETTECHTGVTLLALFRSVQNCAPKCDASVMRGWYGWSGRYC